ncbi:hypothetical protein R3W88_012093 [Solanum pinnatisectum]|uniref:Uncharacterized protein n=1 Tax=Solanum pinnatisectum TaxID=50273 RepID=A0AAV9LAK6_9SOLN|nr:hypothetical protein R3W88_012093 [Solanum pinnatisectum]
MGSDFLRAERRIQITPPNAYYCIYVFDIGDDRVHEASEMLRKWKKAVRIYEKTIVVDRFNAGYDETYKAWLKDNIQGISFSVPNIYHSVEDKESKALIDLRDAKREAQEMRNKFLQKQEEDKYALESVTQELKNLRSDLGELNLWIRDKKSGMCLEDWEEKGRQSERYLLMGFSICICCYLPLRGFDFLIFWYLFQITPAWAFPFVFPIYSLLPLFIFAFLNIIFVCDI